jgi:hypothetical protein
MYGESPTRRPDEADIIGWLFGFLGTIAVLCLLAGSLALPAHACDSSFPKGIHGHKLTTTYAFTFHYDATVPRSDDYAQFMHAVLAKLAQQSDISFQRVSKESDANLVFRVDFYFTEETQVFRTVIHAYGLGKTDDLFVVAASQKVVRGERAGDAAAYAFTEAVYNAWQSINLGWTCPKHLPAHEPGVSPTPKSH